MRKSAGIAILLLAAGCSRKAPEKVDAAAKPQPVAVKTVAAESRQVDRTIALTGSLNPDESVTVSSEVAGRIQSIPVDFGQNVRKGAVVAELDKQEFQLQVDRAKGALAQALARLGLTPAQENVEPSSTPGVRQAAAQMEDSRFKYDSAAKLVKSGDISQERFTELEKAYHARQAALEATRDDVRMQWAALQSLKADVKLAQKRVNDATVRAPFDGSVKEKLVSPGQYMKENTPIVTLVKTNPLRLRVDLPETAAGQVHVGTTLTFTTDAIANKQFHATVRELNPSLDAKSRSLTAEARLSESDSRLRPGMFVQVELVTARQASIVVVPKQALYALAGLTKLFVIRDGRAVELRVSPGQDLGDWVEAPADQVRSGDRVAVSGLPMLFNGTPVSVAPGKAGA